MQFWAERSILQLQGSQNRPVTLVLGGCVRFSPQQVVSPFTFLSSKLFLFCSFVQILFSFASTVSTFYECGFFVLGLFFFGMFHK